MNTRTHYDVLGVAADATEPTIRAAYRTLAREHHPDRQAMSSAATGGHTMPAINEAYRVLNDPGRRAIYDSALRATPRSTAQPTTNGTTRRTHTPSDWVRSDEESLQLSRPARVPWRSLLVVSGVAIVGVVALAQFAGSGRDLGPDGILRNGDCVEIEPNGDAREVACVGVADSVVAAFVPFDGNCPGGTEPHRDRQGMGVACVRLDVAVIGG